MNQEQVQEFATANDLDVRVMGIGKHNKPNHLRLMDEYGKFIADVYFKSTKGGGLRDTNKVFRHRGQRWANITNTNELKQLITQ